MQHVTGHSQLLFYDNLCVNDSFSITVSPTYILAKEHLSFTSCKHMFIFIPRLYRTFYTPLTSRIHLINNFCNTWQSTKEESLSVYMFSPSFREFFSIRSVHMLTILFRKPYTFFSFWTKRPRSFPYKTTDKIVRYILMCTFLDC
jgi:hypothetical protein